MAAVSVVAVAEDGRVAAVLPLDRGQPIDEMQAWCDRQQAAGYRVAPIPWEPPVGAIVAGRAIEAVACDG